MTVFTSQSPYLNSFAYLKTDADYITAHDASVSDTWSGGCVVGQLRESGGTYQIHRQALIWDTSSLGSGVTVLSAYITFGERKELYQQTYHDDFIVVPGDDVDMNGDGKDYGRLLNQVTDCGLINSADLSALGQPVVFNLNASGLNQINKTWLTKLAIRMGRDISTTNPGNNGDGVRCYFSAAPSLTVTYGVNSPAEPFTRVTGLTHHFVAGPNPVYQLEINQGGITSEYISPLLRTGYVEPTVPEVPTTELKPGVTRHDLTLRDYATWLGQRTEADIFRLFGRYPTFQEWSNWYRRMVIGGV